MNIKLQTNERLSATVADGLAGVFVNGVSLSASLSGKADLTALQNYYAKTETSSASEISTALENAGNKVYFDNRISGVTGSNDLSVVKLSADEYAQMLDNGACLSNAVYIVETPNIDAFKQQIKNLAPGTNLSDAVNVEQLNAVSATVHQSLSNCLQNNSSYNGINLTATSQCTFDFPHINLPDTSIQIGHNETESFYAYNNFVELKEKDTDSGYSSVKITTTPDIQIARVAGNGPTPEPPKTPSELMSEIKFTGGTNNSPDTSSLTDLVYQKSETSSATQITTAIDGIRNMISSAMTSTYEYTQHEIEGQ